MALEKFTGASRGVALGKALEGKSALSSFLEGLSDRMQQQDLMNMQIGGQVALKKAEFPLELQLAREKATAETKAKLDFFKSLGIFPGQGQGTQTLNGQTTPIGQNTKPFVGTTQPSGGYVIPQVQIEGVTLANPQVQAEMERQRQFAGQEAKMAATSEQEMGLIRNRIGTIKQVLQGIPPPESQQFASVSGFFRKRAGTLDPRFADTVSTIKTAIGPFLTSVEKISRGRLTQGEINNLASMITELPYLNTQNREKRFQIIDQLLQKGGVPESFMEPSLDEIEAELQRRGE